ncbi:hypothetical protein RV03_GL000854 [Enterococcus gallinarum]|nr:hypothetical protein RV03_GL000854 [Enterococcus gallinarum]
MTGCSSLVLTAALEDGDSEFGHCDAAIEHLDESFLNESIKAELSELADIDPFSSANPTLVLLIHPAVNATRTSK